MTHADLGGRVLASVSRSFYLSIRLLPDSLREPVGLAYLLARASDTIADSSDAPAPARQQHLEAFGRMIARRSLEGLAALQHEIQPSEPAERELITQLQPILEWLNEIEVETRCEIQAVLAKIIRGQALDVQRFSAGGGEPVALETAAQLEEYTYLVAGCVGEFWTRVCFAKLANFSRQPLLEMSRWGAQFGQALQLINVLRDLPADLRQGRCYLPADELAAAGTSPATLRDEPLLARPVVARWHERATTLLASGREYLEAVRPWRVRAACFLPWSLGRETLALMRAQPPLETAQRLKVPRRFVYASLIRALAIGCTRAALPPRGQSL